MHVQMFSNTIALPPSTPKGLIQHNRTLIDCQWCCVKLYLSIKKHAEYNTQLMVVVLSMWLCKAGFIKYDHLELLIRMIQRLQFDNPRLMNGWRC
jgi:hypothetical protein